MVQEGAQLGPVINGDGGWQVGGQRETQAAQGAQGGQFGALKGGVMAQARIGGELAGGGLGTRDVWEDEEDGRACLGKGGRS